MEMGNQISDNEQDTLLRKPVQLFYARHQHMLKYTKKVVYV